MNSTPALDINLREARMEDTPELATLCAQLGYAVRLDQIRVRLPGYMSQDDGWLAVAVAGQQRIVGWMQVGVISSLVDGFQPQILGLVVDQRFRRRGIGRRLVNGAKDWSRRAGFDTLYVRSNAARDEAHTFYPGLGFRLKKTQRCYRIDL